MTFNHNPTNVVFSPVESDMSFIPEYQTTGSAGLDLMAHNPFPHTSGSHTLLPGDRMVIGVGFRIALPVGFEAQIRPRSGLAAKNGVTVLNTPGTIDCDYRGEVKVILINHGSDPFIVKRGDRIAQMVIAECWQVRASTISDEQFKARYATKRGDGGLGSTGS